VDAKLLWQEWQTIAKARLLAVDLIEGERQRDLSEDAVREGSFSSVHELVAAIEAYLAERNLNPKPYRWKAKGEEILAKIQRARTAMAAQSV
jgi:hypothetical protein